jgi:Histidine kinase-, DNA gyrase B-, and HSP90-like ATPase
MATIEAGCVQGLLFEDDYLIRTLGPVAHSNYVALTELVANAWDAGAFLVEIVIPEEKGGVLVVEDDGIGLTPEEFHLRWMKLGYDRTKHQGPKVAFPDGRSGSRPAYGRNGIGRHGLLCFNKEYTVTTLSSGQKSTFKISTRSEEQPFVIMKENVEDGNGHGTRLEVTVLENLPNPDRILEIISARFLHDPQFAIKINGKSVPLEQHAGFVSSSTLTVNSDISLEVLFFDTTECARSTLYQGVAFWQAGRLVGEPSWTLGTTPVIDGRTRFAKRYTFVAKTNDLAECVNDDWTAFSRCNVMKEVYTKLSEHIVLQAGVVAKEHIEETRVSIKRDFRDQLEELSPLGKFEVNEVIEHVVDKHPTAAPEVLGISVEAVINLQSTRSGRALLQKLSQYSEMDIEGLNRFLDLWTIKDALCVLDEIDRRISVIEAISKLSGDSQIDELKILHPLMTEARWLFGPEFDSCEYISNKQLQTVAKKIFRVTSEAQLFENPKKRPDIILLPESTISVTGAAQFNLESDLSELRRILIIELKRGGSNLTRANRDQAVHYVEDFIECQQLTGNPPIFAYVVGETISNKVSRKQTVGDNDQGQVFATTYGQLVDTAHRRLFNLGKTLEERYEGVPGVDLARRQTQLDLDFEPLKETEVVIT